MSQNCTFWCHLMASLTTEFQPGAAVATLSLLSVVMWCHLLNFSPHMDVVFGPKGAQIGPKWDKLIRFQYIFAQQVCPTCGQSDPILAQIWPPCFSTYGSDLVTVVVSHCQWRHRSDVCLSLFIAVLLSLVKQINADWSTNNEIKPREFLNHSERWRTCVGNIKGMWSVI